MENRLFGFGAVLGHVGERVQGIEEEMRIDLRAQSLQLGSNGQVACLPRFEAFQETGELRCDGIQKIQIFAAVRLAARTGTQDEISARPFRRADADDQAPASIEAFHKFDRLNTEGRTQPLSNQFNERIGIRNAGHRRADSPGGAPVIRPMKEDASSRRSERDRATPRRAKEDRGYPEIRVEWETEERGDQREQKEKYASLQDHVKECKSRLVVDHSHQARQEKNAADQHRDGGGRVTPVELAEESITISSIAVA